MTVLRAAAACGLWVAAFFGVWLWFVGDCNRIDVAGAAAGALVAAAAAETTRRVAHLSLSVSFDVLGSSALVLPVVFADFGLLVIALARSLAARRVVRGHYVTRPFDPGAKTTAAGAARRAWTVLLAGYSPNAYVVDIDADRGTVLLHDLVPWRRSEEPA